MGEQHPSKPLPANQLAFEQAAMEEICARSGPLGEIIRKQYLAARVTERWGSGAGFYTDYEVEECSDRVRDEVFDQVAIATFEMTGVGRVEHETADGYLLMMCQLHVSKEGVLYCLECVNFGGGRWPTDWYVWRDVPGDGARRSSNA